MKWLISYWYHFAIMFEALFILTTIDAGTRIGRFLVQEFLGKLWKPLGDLDWPPASMLATGLVVFGWAYFIYTGSVETIWPMFGMANQLLAVIALAVVTTWLVNAGRGRYAPVTLLPMLFVATTTSTAAYQEITGKFLEDDPGPGRGPRLAQHRPDRAGRLVRARDPRLGPVPLALADEADRGRAGRVLVRPRYSRLRVREGIDSGARIPDAGWIERTRAQSIPTSGIRIPESATPILSHILSRALRQTGAPTWPISTTCRLVPGKSTQINPDFPLSSRQAAGFLDRFVRTE